MQEQENLQYTQADLEKMKVEKQEWIPKKWTNVPTLEDVKRDLQDSMQFRDAQASKIDEWLDHMHVRGAARPKATKGFSSVQPKLIRKQAEWRYAPLSEPFLSTDDLFIASPTSWEDKEGAVQHQLVLNYQFSSAIDKVKFIDDYVHTVVDEGTAIVRVGWDFQEATVEEMVPQYRFDEVESEEDMANLEQAAQGMMHHKPEWMSALAHSQIAGRPLKPVFVREVKQTKTKTTSNKPTVEVIETQNLVADPSCKGDLAKAMFLIYMFETSIAQLKLHSYYHDLDKIVVTPTGTRDTANFKTNGDDSFNYHDRERTLIRAYEYWGYKDLLGDGVLRPFVMTWVGETIIRMEDNPFPDNEHPFINVQYLPVRRSIYGEPDAELIIDNQKIAGAITRGMVDIMGRSANAQMGIRKGALDVVNRRRFDNGLDYEFNGQGNPDQHFFMHKYPEIPSSAPLMLQYQNNDADALTGVKSFAGGMSGDALGKTSAQAVRGVLDAASKREASILRRLASGIVKIGKKIIAMNTVFLEEHEIIRVTNETFVEIHRDKLIGEYDLRLNITTEEDNAAKTQELAFMLQTIGNNIGPEMTQIILSEIARLRKMPDLAKRIETYVPRPDPIAEQRAMLEIEIMKAQAMEKQAQAQERIANAQLHMSRAGTEQTKQGNIQSDTSLKNLDLIEQESGVKQVRELEKSSAQAKANMELKLFEKQVEEAFPKNSQEAE